MIDPNILSNEERVSLALRSLYRSRGYEPYRMSRFEDYELYVKNKDFLRSPEVISFTDSDGRLKALKPDVTLSIVRSARPAPGEVKKLCYDESVFRVSETSRRFREIRQVGLECIGTVDERCRFEVLALALESLRLISPDSRLCLSLPGVVEAALDGARLEGDARRDVLRCMGEKNLHELRAVCEGAGLRAEDAERLRRLTLLSAPPGEALHELKSLDCPEEELRTAERLADALPPEAEGRVCMDFSVLGDMRYYSGVAFQGYVRGVPSSVLSGGVYTRLLRRMGRSGDAIGFACYLDKLERFESGVSGDA